MSLGRGRQTPTPERQSMTEPRCISAAFLRFCAAPRPLLRDHRIFILAFALSPLMARLLCKAALLAAAAAGAPCPYTAYPDTDFNNGDLPNQPASKALSQPAECAALCCATPGCAAFSLNAGAAGARWCYLKGASGWSSGPSQGCASGCLASAGAACPAPPPPPGPPAYFPWFNLSIPMDQRLELLLQNFTFAEANAFMNDGVPALPRLGLPAFSWEGEALHGVSWAGVATVFPGNIAWGATFSPELVFEIADVIATEARAKYVLGRGTDGSSAEFQSLSFMLPNVNLFIDPLWGRGQESAWLGEGPARQPPRAARLSHANPRPRAHTARPPLLAFGEDPLLTSAITTSLVRALQFGSLTETPPYTRIIATSKRALPPAAALGAAPLRPRWRATRARIPHSRAPLSPSLRLADFLGYHLESWAGDAQYRLSHSFNYTEADIQQTYMPAFTAALLANVTAVMCAYDGSNTTNPAWPHPRGPEPWGVPMCASTEMARLLRDPALGWEGYVISDEGSISFASRGYHGYTDSLVDAAALCLNAGTDLALGGEYASTLPQALAQGNITLGTVKQSLRRLLRAQFALGWFDSLAALRGNFTDPVPWNSVGDADLVTPAARRLAYRAASESLVLLKNARGALPLTPAPGGATRIALIGPAADDAHSSTGSYLGNYAPCEDGPGGALSADPRCHVVTLLEALTAAAAAPAAPFALAYAPGCSINGVGNTSGFPAALAAAAGAHVIIAAVGLDTCQESACSEGEANDRGVAGGRYPAAGLDLGGEQLPLLAALRAANPAAALIVVLLNGGPVSSPWVMANADAVLEAWYPGLEGGAAIADALLGAAIPGGRMPVTTVRSPADLPPHTDFVLATPPGRTHRYATLPPLLPFGFGLSYVNFSYSSLGVEPASVCASALGAVRVSASVARAPASAPARLALLPADEVVQLYGASGAAAVPGVTSPPRQQLLAFRRLAGMGEGEARSVEFALGRRDFTLYLANGTMGVQAGNWSLTLGGGGPSSEDFGAPPVLRGSILVMDC